MNLISLAISILWLLIGIIIILGVVWLVFYGIKKFVEVPERIEQMVWLVIFILILIAILSLLAGGGGGFRGFRLSGITDPAVAALSWTPSRHYAA